MKKFPIHYNAPVTVSFSLLSLLALGLNILTGGAANKLVFSVYRCPLRDILAYPRFFLHVLGHSGYSHYISNMLLLLVIGPAMEEKYGSRRILLFIVITAFVTGLAQFLCFPGSALLGASGVVFMLIMLSSLSGVRDGAIPWPPSIWAARSSRGWRRPTRSPSSPTSSAASAASCSDLRRAWAERRADP